jgi:hypothetical protein
MKRIRENCWHNKKKKKEEMSRKGRRRQNMTKKRFFEVARTGLEPAAITIYADPFPMKYKFIVSISWCNGLFGERLHGTNSKENSEKMQAKFSRWLAEYKKA